MHRVLDWLFTVPFLLAFGLLLRLRPLQRASRLFGQRPQEIVAGAAVLSALGVPHLRDAAVRSNARRA
jgi:hypothetical protein